MKPILRRGVAATSLASLIFVGTVMPSQAQTPDGYDEQMLQLINEYRASQGLDPVEEWDGLSTAAYSHSNEAWSESLGKEMTSDLLYSLHASPSEIAAEGAAVGCTPAMAENIHFATFVDPEAAMDAYLNSPSHEAAISNPDFSYVGLGTFVGEDGRLFNTQRFAQDCTDGSEVVESAFSQVSAARTNDGGLLINAVLSNGSDSNPIVDVAAPDGSVSQVTGISTGTDGQWSLQFTDSTPNVSGTYELSYAGETGVSLPASYVVEHDASTAISGWTSELEVALSNEDVALPAVTVAPGYGRTVVLQESVDGEWVDRDSSTVDGGSEAVSFSVPGATEDQTRVYRVVAPEANVAEGATSGNLTVDFRAPETVVTGLITSIETQWGDARPVIEFSVNSEGPRDAILSVGDEVIDTVEDFTGNASFRLPRNEVGVTDYTLTIPGNMYGTPYETTITVDVSKRTTVIEEFEGTDEVYVGEAVEESDLLFFVNRPVGTEGVIEVLEDGEWVEANTFTVGQDHFTRATIPAQDEPGTYTYRATVPESDTHTAAVSGERSVVVNLYEREASSNAESHEVFVGDEGQEITVEAAGDGEAHLQHQVGGEWVSVDEAVLADGSASLTVPAVMEEGEHYYRVHVPATATHQEWTGETFTVTASKQDTTLSGWDGGSLAIAEDEELSYDVNVTPAAADREVVLQSSEDGSAWEDVATFTTNADGEATVVIPAGELDTTVDYRVVVAEAPLYNETASETLSVTVQEFPTNVNGVPEEDITQRYGDEVHTFNIGIDNAQGREVLLQRFVDDEWETVTEYTAPDAAQGLVTITLPAPEAVGTTSYRVFLPEIYRGAEWTSTPFSVVVDKAATELTDFASVSYEIGEPGDEQFTTFALPAGGEGLDREAYLYELVDDEWVEVGGPFAQGGNIEFGTAEEIVVTYPVDEVGTSAYRVEIPATDTHEGAVGNNFEVEVTLRTDTTIDGDAPEDVVVEVGAGEEIVITYSSEFERDWMVQRLMLTANASVMAAPEEPVIEDENWETVHEVTDSTTVAYTVPTDEAGTFLYRVVSPETDVLAAFVSPVTTVEVALVAPEFTGWEGGELLVDEGEAPEPISATSTHPFILQVLDADGDWAALDSYEEGTQEIELPAAEADYRLFVAGTDGIEETASEVLQVRYREEAPAPTPVPEDTDEDEGAGDDNDGDNNDGDDTTVVVPPVNNSGGRGTPTTLVPATTTATTGQGNGINRLPTLGSEASPLTLLALLSVISGLGVLGVRRFGLGSN